MYDEFLFFLLIDLFMGYSYRDTLENNSRRDFIDFRCNVLQTSNCASIDHLQNVVNIGRFRLLPSERNILQWVDERNEMISISFLAILDLNGAYGCIPPNFVSFPTLFYLIRKHS